MNDQHDSQSGPDADLPAAMTICPRCLATLLDEAEKSSRLRPSAPAVINCYCPHHSVLTTAYAMAGKVHRLATLFPVEPGEAAEISQQQRASAAEILRRPGAAAKRRTN